MFNLLLALMFSASFGLNAMDLPSDKLTQHHNSKKKSKRISLPFSPAKNPSLSHDGIAHSNKIVPSKKHVRQRSMSLSEIQEREEPKVEHGFIVATRTLNTPLIQFYLSGKSFNPNKIKDAKYGNTVLHVIAGTKSKLDLGTNPELIEQNKIIDSIINIFLQDYRTDFSLLNNARSTPRDLLPNKTDDHIKWRMMFFARCSLNILINNTALKLKNAFIWGSISPDVIDASVQSIIKRSLDIEQQQEEEGRILPSASRLPSYATKEFITEMLMFQLDFVANN